MYDSFVKTDDSDIKEDVENELRWDPDIDATDIAVAVSTLLDEQHVVAIFPFKIALPTVRFLRCYVIRFDHDLLHDRASAQRPSC